ncbi:MAG: hypothetical protein C0601_12405 [Candidatus Muiribacterium halophilum]|uniref:ABC transmembrane type-1 domain-containing protein n=1 Tax=Muiribacterium halophilum TaxID=2053465 RepID=A0A2N5ZAR4_MUIH1|nr:MAG: hypothetical protein C0601_12405 [Candidatus Muirbacterium halophilum]
MPKKKLSYGYSQLFSVMLDSFKYWKLFLIGFITLLFVTGMDIYFPYFTRNIINDFIGSRVVEINSEEKINGYLLKDPKDALEFENKNIKVYTVDGLKYVKHSDLKKMPKKQLRRIREKDVSGILKRLKFILILLFMYIIIYFVHYFSINYIGQTMMYDLRNRVFKKLTGFKMSYYTQIPVCVLVTRVINDVESINKFFS